jgi:hypothetical protein
LGNLPSAILWTWLYHVSWFCSVSFIIVSFSLICCLIVTFIILSFLNLYYKKGHNMFHLERSSAGGSAQSVNDIGMPRLQDV